MRLDDKMIKELEELRKQQKAAMSEVLRITLEIGIKQLRTQRALQLLREGKISTGKAAELSGVSIYEMLELMKEHDISYGYGIEDLKEDLKRFKK